ncbi:transposase family protein [Micromonospora sp. NPDC049102]|uniref:transposase family protein n=1 Tax=Micromonospora sp. NPDC049102 TaxID=3364265 RepID=UPI0037155F2F
MHTPHKQPAAGRRLAVDNRAYNAVLRSMRCLGERGFAILVGRWRTLRHRTASPRQVGDVVRAALHLTHFEYRYLPDSCGDHVNYLVSGDRFGGVRSCRSRR